jgi:hypothetical protein
LSSRAFRRSRICIAAWPSGERTNICGETRLNLPCLHPLYPSKHNLLSS